MNEKLDYFIQRTEQDINDLKCSHTKLHEKIDTILEFKWQIIGGAMVVAAMVSIGISFASLVNK